MEPSQLPSLISAGGVTALAILVYLELRAMRPILRSLEKAISALLERDRMRSTPHRGVPIYGPHRASSEADDD